MNYEFNHKEYVNISKIKKLLMMYSNTENKIFEYIINVQTLL